MIDVDGDGHIGYPEFEMVIQTTQRILGYVDEFLFWWLLMCSITGSGSGSVEMNRKVIKQLYESMEKDSNGEVAEAGFKAALSQSNNIVTWMNHVIPERSFSHKPDFFSHLPFYVHNNMTVSERSRRDV